jgi:hypothetical protein
MLPVLLLEVRIFEFVALIVIHFLTDICLLYSSQTILPPTLLLRRVRTPATTISKHHTLPKVLLLPAKATIEVNTHQLLSRQDTAI